MNTGPAGDDILTETDAVNILEELRTAQNHAHLLGLALEINPVDVTAIVETYEKPLDRLLHIILKFLSQSEPPPTWRTIVNALRSPIVNLTALAKRVEAAHFPDPTASHESRNQTKDRELAETQQQLRERVRMQDTQLKRAKNTIRREQQMREIVSLVCVCFVCVCVL